MRPLEGMQVVTLAVNIPGPVAVSHLCRLGATATKIEPPGGDPLARFRLQWYEALHQGMTVLTLDLRETGGREQLESHLARCDLLVTATRPAALRRLALDWDALHARHPHL